MHTLFRLTYFDTTLQEKLSKDFPSSQAVSSYLKTLKFLDWKSVRVTEIKDKRTGRHWILDLTEVDH